MDDESYFCLVGSDFYGNDFYYSHESLEAPNNVKYKFVSEFPQKVMVWLTTSSRGISQPYVTRSGNATNAKIYTKECINKRLVKFIKKYYSDLSFIFWRNLASAHYAKHWQSLSASTSQWNLRIQILQMYHNCAQLRHFGPICKEKSTKMVGQQVLPTN
jgi:hypothetical protein